MPENDDIQQPTPTALAAARCSAAPSELVEALKDMNRHIEALENIGGLGVTMSIVAAKKSRDQIIAALCEAQQNAAR